MRKTIYIAMMIGAAIVLLASGCKKKKGDEVPLLSPGDLTVIPLAEADYHVITPLGNINPPGHVYPSDHQGFYVQHFGTPSNVRAPGKLRIYEISRDRHNVGQPGETQDFTVTFGSPNSYRLWLGHIATISTKLQQAVNGFAGAACNQYTAGVVHEKCAAKVSVDVEPGEIIGTTGFVAGQFGLDFGLFINNKYECVMNYFAAPQKAALEAKTGHYNPGAPAGIIRVKPPLCGEVYQNVNGTLHGIWLQQGLPKFPEDPNIGFLKDYLDPDIPVLSIGTGLGPGAGGAWKITPAASGFKNRKFTDVTPNGSTYCYDIGSATASVIVKMNDNSKITVEYRPGCNCNCNTGYAFSAAAKVFVRE